MQYAVASSAAMKSPMASRPPLLCSLHRMYHRLAIEAFLDYSAGADGYTPEKQATMQKLANAQMEPQIEASSYDNWQARNLTTWSPRAPKRSCGLGYSNDKSVHHKLWQEVKPLLLPNISHLFWEILFRGKKQLKKGQQMRKHPQAPS